MPHCFYLLKSNKPCILLSYFLKKSETNLLGKEKVSIISYMKIASDVLGNISLFPFINLLVALTSKCFFTAKDLIVQVVLSIINYVLIKIYYSFNSHIFFQPLQSFFHVLAAFLF